MTVAEKRKERKNGRVELAPKLMNTSVTRTKKYAINVRNQYNDKKISVRGALFHFSFLRYVFKEINN